MQACTYDAAHKPFFVLYHPPKTFIPLTAELILLSHLAGNMCKPNQVLSFLPRLRSEFAELFKVGLFKKMVECPL